MRCDECGEEDDVFFIRREGSSDELRLCHACAARRGYAGTESLVGADFASFLSLGDDENPAPGLACPACGQVSGALLSSGRLGCAGCVSAFRRELSLLWRRAGRPEGYAGKVPAGVRRGTPATARAWSLSAELEAAVGTEDFEKAAALRDEIRRSAGAGGR